MILINCSGNEAISATFELDGMIVRNGFL